MVRCGPGLDLNGCEMKNRLIVLPGRIEAKRPADLADANKPWGNSNCLKAINRTKDREKLRKSTNFLIISFSIYFRFSINFSFHIFRSFSLAPLGKIYHPLLHLSPRVPQCPPMHLANGVSDIPASLFLNYCCFASTSLAAVLETSLSHRADCPLSALLRHSSEAVRSLYLSRPAVR